MKLTKELQEELYNKSHCNTEDRDAWYFDLDNDTCYDANIYTPESFVKYNDGALLGAMDLQDDDLIVAYYDNQSGESVIRKCTEDDLNKILQ